MLRVEHLSVYYGDTAAVRDVSFRPEAGQWWMIVGPNGAGKSTLVKAMCRGIPFTGKAYLNDVEISDHSGESFARKVGVLSQNNGQVYGFTVDEVVSMGRYAWRKGYFRPRDREGEEKIRNALEATGLLGMRKRNLLTLSGGEVQRVFLAQVLAQDPQVLVLDEPANHLDFPFQKQFFDMVQAWLAHPGRTVITVMHDLTMARRYGSHALLMNRGQAVASGPVEAVLTRRNLEEVYGMDVYAWIRESLRAWEAE